MWNKRSRAPILERNINNNKYSGICLMRAEESCQKHINTNIHSIISLAQSIRNIFAFPVVWNHRAWPQNAVVALHRFLRNNNSNSVGDKLVVENEMSPWRPLMMMLYTRRDPNLYGNYSKSFWPSASWFHPVAPNGPLARYAKLRAAHAPGMPGAFSPPPTSKETAS